LVYGKKMSAKRKEPPSIVPVAEESDILKLTPLGAGNEVGRSCILYRISPRINHLLD
jgi:cleavage and polyadenylation specificity factor subunit 3